MNMLARTCVITLTCIGYAAVYGKNCRLVVPSTSTFKLLFAQCG